MMHANNGQVTPKTQHLLGAVFVFAIWNMRGKRTANHGKRGVK